MYKLKVLTGRFLVTIAAISIAWLILSATPSQAAIITTYTSTTDFNYGVGNMTTETTRYNVSAGTIELDAPYMHKDANLTSYWRFEGDMTDETGANGGTAGVTGFTTGKFGQGNNRDEMAVANDTSLQPGTGDFTIATWFKRAASSMGDYNIYVQGSSNNLMLRMYNNFTLTVYSNQGAEEEEVMTTGTYAAQCWYFIAATYDITANYWQIYVNGTPAAQIVTVNGTVTNHTQDSDITIGNAYAILDETQVYSRALTAAELLAMYNNGNQYAISGYWDSPIITKPDMDVINNVGIGMTGAGLWSNISKIAVVDVVAGTEITATSGNITAGGYFDYSDFSNGLLCTRGKIVKVRIYITGLGNATATITEVSAWYEPGGAFFGGTQGHTERIIGAMQIRKGVNRVALQWTGPEVSIVRWDFGDGIGGEGASTSHIYETGGNYTITAIGYTAGGDRLWTNATLHFETESVVFESVGNWHHITVTNVTLFSSGIVMFITAQLYKGHYLFFKWNTPALRTAIGAALVFAGIIFTPGVLPDTLLQSIGKIAGVILQCL